MSRGTVLYGAALLLSGAVASAADTSLEDRLTNLEKLLLRDPIAFEDTLERRRKPPLASGERAQLIQSLPEEGHVTQLTSSQMERLLSLGEVFEPLQRKDVYYVQVFEAPQAFLGLHDRTVVLISVNALDLLDHHELKAMVTHEAGHEYFWDDYAEARALRSESAQRRIELLADAVALLKGRKIGLNHTALIAGIRKLEEFNAVRLGKALNASAYPATNERVRAIRNLANRLERQPSRPVK
jgi:hypothetical protein